MRAASAACSVLAGVCVAGRTGSGGAPSEAGSRAWGSFSRNERQAHWSWTYCAAILPHPGEGDDSSGRLKQKVESLLSFLKSGCSFKGEMKLLLDVLSTETPGDSRTSTSNFHEVGFRPLMTHWKLNAESSWVSVTEMNNVGHMTTLNGASAQSS